MRSLTYLAIVLSLLAAVAFVCIRQSDRVPTESGEQSSDAVNAAGPPVPLQSFVFYEWSPFGGRAVWAKDDRSATIQLFGPPPAGRSGLWERRYRSALANDQWSEVERLVGLHNILTLRSPSRNPVPDEAHVFVVVITKAGENAKVSTWAGTKHPQFVPVYEYLSGLCRSDGELEFEGSYEAGGRPAGFTAPWD